VAERVRPDRADGHGGSWAVLAAHHARLKELLDAGPDGGQGRELLARDSVVVPARTLHRYALEVLGRGRDRSRRFGWPTANRAPIARSGGWACWTGTGVSSAGVDAWSSAVNGIPRPATSGRARLSR